MLKLLTFLLAAHGATYIVTLGGIFRPAREWLKSHASWLGSMLCCPMCFGFWSGVAFALAGFWSRQTHVLALDAFAAGCASSAFTWTVHVVLRRLGEDEL